MIIPCELRLNQNSFSSADSSGAFGVQIQSLHKIQKNEGKKRGHVYCPPIYKSQKVARITNNGYLNFLTEYKKRFCGISPQDMVRYAAKQWNQLSVAEKERFKNKPTVVLRSPAQLVAFESKCEVADKTEQQCPSQRQSPSARQRKSERSSSRSRTSYRSVKSRLRGKPSPQQTKRSLSHLGSAVAYIHFLRKFQRKNPNLATAELLKTATRLWCRLDESQRHAFERPLWIVQIKETKVAAQD
ncbi:LOW QUALITY PROTEIN: protamine-like protein 99C [Drosophila santomea]|uniref:LOW QUALITY PROTEIN: protamine-like protein 99C n=1 Tax=Drosophila santomea TaxID=129105 RepID=UPI001CCF0EB6|nr:LOW QUALITY PROTEIN: protamine-like protein 99C [Drosophila santomea]